MTGRKRRSVYVEDSVYAELERRALIAGRSTNAEVCEALRAYVGPLTAKPQRPAPKPPRPRNAHADELVALLEDRVLANGRPAHLVCSRSWYDAARLLLERDHRDYDEARALIGWATSDTFWRANVLSMDTFRRQYDKLRLQRGRSRTHGVEPKSDGGVKFQSAWLARRFPRADQAVIERLVGDYYREHGCVPGAAELANRLEAA